MKECKILHYLYMAETGIEVGKIGKCRIKEFPEVEKELNIYLQQGWKITPMGFGEFYLEREIR